MKASKKTSSLSDQIRDAIRDDGRSLYELAEDAAVNRSSLSRFMAGERTITLETADQVARVLKLRIAGGGR
jgi:plasmid maintenance system antidote protein VapI